MSSKKIQKTIIINAPAKKVWEVLFDDVTYRQWTSVFSPDSYADTDWQLGSKAKFVDQSGSGMLGRIIESKPFERLVIEYDGIMDRGVEDTTSEFAKSFRGGIESYTLKEGDGLVELYITSDMDESMYEEMNNSWDKALVIVKKLSEEN